MSPRPRRVPAPAAPALVVALALALTAPLVGGPSVAPAHGSANARTVARHDSVSLDAGSGVAMDVLRNDRVAGGRRAARIRVVSAPTGITLSVTRQRKVVVRAPQQLPGGTYRARYRVTAQGRSDMADIVITVVPRAQTPSPAPAALPPLTPELLASHREEALGHLNAYRAEHGLAPVVLDEDMNDFAQARAEEVYAGSPRRQLDTATEFFELFGSGGLAFCEGVEESPEDGPDPVKNTNYLREAQVAGLGYHYDEAGTAQGRQPVWTAYVFDGDPSV